MFGFHNFVQNYLIANLLQQSNMGATSGLGGGAGQSASSGGAAAHSSAVAMAESEGQFMGSSDVVSTSETAMSSISSHTIQSPSHLPGSHPVSAAMLMAMVSVLRC